MYSSIQDLGRLGYRKFGVPCSGAMDHLSFRKANTTIANNENDAVLEMTIIGPTLQFLCSTEICISGASMNPKLNDTDIPNDEVVSVNENDILNFGRLELGTRAYLAVAKGFQTELLMGSRSMYNNITSARRIQNDDILPIISEPKAILITNSGISKDLDHLSAKILAAYKGPEFDLLSTSSQDKLFNQDFTISNTHSRMGYQLNEFLENDLKSILTSHVLPGTVQLTPSGKLLVLMRDAQTTGGYPRVLQLSESAINIMAQKNTNDKISYRLEELITLE